MELRPGLPELPGAHPARGHGDFCRNLDCRVDCQLDGSHAAHGESADGFVAFLLAQRLLKSRDLLHSLIFLVSQTGLESVDSGVCGRQSFELLSVDWQPAEFLLDVPCLSENAVLGFLFQLVGEISKTGLECLPLESILSFYLSLKGFALFSECLDLFSESWDL